MESSNPWDKRIRHIALHLSTICTQIEEMRMQLKYSRNKLTIPLRHSAYKYSTNLLVIFNFFKTHSSTLNRQRSIINSQSSTFNHQLSTRDPAGDKGGTKLRMIQINGVKISSIQCIAERQCRCGGEERSLMRFRAPLKVWGVPWQEGVQHRVGNTWSFNLHSAGPATISCHSTFRSQPSILNFHPVSLYHSLLLLHY